MWSVPEVVIGSSKSYLPSWILGQPTMGAGKDLDCTPILDESRKRRWRSTDQRSERRESRKESITVKGWSRSPVCDRIWRESKGSSFE